ncbi:hypothetical protein DSO57_1014288 [Entomophthora muscae]|uniref:Uncharacterized protein n=1 Tax=Entomophthora muscae TaxID=34485 RepID=A0ACC2S7E5_9FUNG|nr:hypothetical protein DSO57_1014288 [Entomophthora muscae]
MFIHYLLAFTLYLVVTLDLKVKTSESLRLVLICVQAYNHTLQARTPDVNPQDVHKDKFTTLVLTPICILLDTQNLQDTPAVVLLQSWEEGSLPDFYFDEDLEAFLLDVEDHTAIYTEKQKIIFLLNSLCQNSFDTILYCLIQGYPYDNLKRVFKRKIFYPQAQAKARPKKILETVAQPKDCHLEAPTLANVNSETPTCINKPFSEKLYPIGAGDCFKDEKVSEDAEASQEEKVIELLISQVKYRSLAENITVSLLSLLKSLPPEEPAFSMQPLNKPCSSKGFEDKCLPKGYHLESFGSLALTEVNPGQSSSPGITERYIQLGHFPCEDHQSCAKVNLTRAKVFSNDVFTSDKLLSTMLIERPQLQDSNPGSLRAASPQGQPPTVFWAQTRAGFNFGKSFEAWQIKFTYINASHTKGS